MRGAEGTRRTLFERVAARGQIAAEIPSHAASMIQRRPLDAPARRIDRGLQVLPEREQARPTWTWPCGCITPPITPNATNGLPSFVAKAGMIVCNGRFAEPT